MLFSEFNFLARIQTWLQKLKAPMWSVRKKNIRKRVKQHRLKKRNDARWNIAKQNVDVITMWFASIYLINIVYLISGWIRWRWYGRCTTEQDSLYHKSSRRNDRGDVTYAVQPVGFYHISGNNLLINIQISWSQRGAIGSESSRYCICRISRRIAVDLGKGYVAEFQNYSQSGDARIVRKEIIAVRYQLSIFETNFRLLTMFFVSINKKTLVYHASRLIFVWRAVLYTAFKDYPRLY